ncbi:MAG: hypothetical protein IT260_00365 [Saprospiraceae bacterium]|nr:hypothetical protein [Saprospiraceae bacterium]
MADPQEYTSIDELFRKTFDDLPDSPSPSGWDAPSPKVWDQVQVRIKPPHSGWTAKSILLVSGLAIALMLGLYWSLSQPSAPAVADAPQTSVAAAPTAPALPPASSEQAQAAAPETTETATPERRTSPRPKAARKVAPSIAAAGNPQVQEERPSDDSLRRRPSGSAPLPGTNPNMPNTTVRRQVEAWRKAPWAQPLAPLPTILEMQVVHPVPPALKNLVQPTH